MIRIERQWISASRLELHPHPKLRREWDAHRCPGTKEVAQSACRNSQLFEAGDWLGCGTGRIQAKGRGVGQVVDRRRQRGNIRDKVVPRIGPVQEVEELGKRTH